MFIAGEDAYYEFEINALNTIYEVFWIWKDIFQPGNRYFGRPEFNPAAHPTMEISGIGGHVHPRGERWGFLDWDFPGLRHAVHVEGVLNKRAGTDKGWSAELAFPWKGLELLADGRSLPPRDGDVWRIDCSRFQQVGPDGKRLDPSAGWTWNRHGHYDSHIPETFTYVHFSTADSGNAIAKNSDMDPRRSVYHSIYNASTGSGNCLRRYPLYVPSERLRVAARPSRHNSNIATAMRKTIVEPLRRVGVPFLFEKVLSGVPQPGRSQVHAHGSFENCLLPLFCCVLFAARDVTPASSGCSLRRG